jgi:hypothetical protein
VGPLAAISLLWLATASREVLGGDNGEFATLAVTGGAAHPPGYPLVAMYLHAMRWLPGVSPAHRAAVANVLVAIAALAVLARACRAWGASRTSTSLACIAWALAPITWAMATEAEVFAANALFAAVLLQLTAPGAEGKDARRAVTLAFVAGLALTNNYTIACVAPLGVHAFVRAVSRSPRPWATCAASLAGFAAGLTPYLFLFAVAERSLDPATWSWGSVHDGASLVAYLARTDYPSPALNSADHTAAELVRLTRELVGLPLLALAGAVVWAARARRRGRSSAALAAWVLLGTSVALAGPAVMAVFHEPLDGPGGAVAARFDLLPMTLLAPIVARAIDEIGRARAWRAAPALVAEGALLVALAVRGFGALQAHQRHAVALYTRNALLSAPPNAVIVGETDSRLFAFAYARYALGERADVTFVNPRLLLAGWYHARMEQVLGMTLPPVTDHSLDAVALIRRLLASGRPLFVTDVFSPKALGRFPSYPVGPLIRLVADRRDVPSAEEVERMNVELAARFEGEPLPLPGPEPWGDGLCEDYLRPWDALAGLFTQQGDAARAQANAKRAEEARACRWR